MALVKAFLDKSAKVIATGTSDETINDLRSIKNKNLIIEKLNLTDPTSIQAVISKHQQIDIFINNAGVWDEGKMGEINNQSIQKTIATNLSGVIQATNTVVPIMKRQGHGTIINVVSTSGLKARAEQSVYVASKFGLRGFTDAIREELLPDNIDVIGVYPGGMSTKFYSRTKSSVDASKWMDPHEVADVIINTIEHDQTLVVDHLVISRKKTKHHFS